MTCRKCQHDKVKRFGKYGKEKIQRYRCRYCSATFSELRQKPLGSHYTPVDDASRAVMEDMSIRSVSRLTGLHKGTILSLLLTIGENCRRLLDAKVRNIRPNYVQADEAWTYVFCKSRRLKGLANPNPEWGDMYIWIALDSDTKAILSYRIGKRDGPNAYEFIEDLSQRVTEDRFQFTTDGMDGYLAAVEEHFGDSINYTQLVKIYGKPRTDGPDWYRPSPFVTLVPTPLRGRPNRRRISTSHVERINLTLRSHMRRMTRLSNGFSKSLKHLKAAVTLFVAWYNFCKIHQTLRVTPGMEAGITDHVWSIEELLKAATNN